MVSPLERLLLTLKINLKIQGPLSDRYVQFVKSPYLLVLITYMVPEFSEFLRNTFCQGSRNFFLLTTL